MSNKNALITKAMLASYISGKHMDYLNMIEPFVIEELPKSLNSKIDISEITHSIREKYGLIIKQKIVEKILIRLSKTKNDAIIRKTTERSGHKNYYLNTMPKYRNFDKKREKIKNIVYEVINCFKDYYNENSVIKKINEETAQKMLIDYLEKYNYETYVDINNISKIKTDEKFASSNYKVANFILNEYKKVNGCFNKIRILQEGYFASTAIYYFSKNDEHISSSTKLNKTLFVLDTRLLIDALQLNTISDANSMLEMLELIKDNGGKICTFDYYFDELYGIIQKYITDKSARITLDLDYFRRNQLKDIEIKLYNKNLKEKLEQDLKISIIEKPDYSKLIEKQTWHIDSLELKRNILQYVEYTYDDADVGFKNDYDTIESIAYYRFNSKYNTLNNCKAIFVTSNNGLIQAAKKTYQIDKQKEEIELAISDIDLTAILWLSNYNEKSNLPELILLENAYAALSPTKDILNDVLRIIENNINSNDEQTKNDAIILRYDPYLLNNISEVIQNDKRNISDNTIIELTNRMKNRAKFEAMTEVREDVTTKTKEAVETKYEKQYQEKENTLIQKEKELDSRDYKVEQKSKKADLMLKQANEKIQSAEAQSKEFAETKKNYVKVNYKLKKILDNENKKCEKYAKIGSKSFLLISILFSSCVMLYILYNCFYIMVENIIINKELFKISNQIITLIGTIATFMPILIGCIKILKKISHQLYERIYQFFYKHSKILNDRTDFNEKTPK